MPNKLETQLRKCGRALAWFQTARLFKVPEELSQTPCDFFGYTAKGRAILVEAKMVRSTSLAIGKDQGTGLQIHQWNALCEAHRAGALALLVWSNNGVCACLTVPMIEELLGDRRSIPWKEIDPSYHRPIQEHERLLEPWLGREPEFNLHEG